MQPFFRHLAAVGTLFVSSVSAQAAIVTFSAVTAAPNGAVTGAARDERLAFGRAVTVTATETFGTDTTPSADGKSFSFFTVACSYPGVLGNPPEPACGVQNSGSDGSPDSGQVSSGRFDTTGGNGSYLRTNSNIDDTVGSFVLTFANEVAAFGFYLTDLGDFGFTPTITVSDSLGHTLTYDLPSSAANGSLGFFGLASSDEHVQFTSFTIALPRLGTSGDDLFGIDDVVIGRIGGSTPVPLPGTITLLGAGLLALAMRRRAPAAS